MRNKILKVFLAIIITVPVVFPVFAISQEELLARLDILITDVEDIKAEYDEMLNTYSDVIESLSNDNKQAIKNIHQNMAADDLKETIQNIKDELSVSTIPEATEVIAAIEDLEQDAKALVDENKDLIEEVKTSYTDMSSSEIKEVIEKVKDVVDVLGYETDTTESFNKVMDIMDEAHNIALDINEDIKKALANHHDVFVEALNKNGVKGVVNAVKTKDIDKVITAMKNTLNGVSGADALRADLDALKTKATNMKNTIKEIKNVDNADLLLFTNAQNESISNKIKLVEQDYIDFIKLIINDYLEVYLESMMEYTYDKNIDTAIDYANNVLDYYAEYKDMEFDTEKIINKLPKDAVESLGLVVALGYVDLEEYNKEYITGNFGTEIDNIIDFLSEEFLDYLTNLEIRFENELQSEVNKDLSSAKIQTNVKALTTSRFNTLNDLKALRNRAEKEILSKVDGVMDKVELVEPLAYDVFNTSILNNIETTMELEKEKSDKTYEADTVRKYILTNVFETSTNLYSKFGIPSANKGILTYTKLAKTKIKTTSTMTITLSEGVTTTYTYSVLGDVYADGGIDARDYMMIKNYIMEDETLDKSRLLAADTYRDNKIDARDYMKIKNKIMENEKITL